MPIFRVKSLGCLVTPLIFRSGRRTTVLARARLSLPVLILLLLSLPSFSQAVTGPKPVNVVVFSDFACPYSAQMFFTLQKLQQEHPSQMHITWKQSPLPIHPGSPLAHRAALAAGRQGKYNAMAELLFANQTHQELPALLADARQLHLDVPRFRRDMDSPEIAAELAANLQETDAFGVQQTPALFIQGRSFIGVQSEEILLTALQKADTASSTEFAAASSGPTIPPAMMAELQTAPPSASRGSALAPLTIVEFTDFQCPFCRAAVDPMEQFIAARGQDVRWVVRSFPLDFHQDSELANEAALAAGDQGKFWEMHDLIFAHQQSIKAADLRGYAEELHLEMKSFDEALASHRFAGQIAADRALGVKAGVTGTPTFIIDGEVMSGARSLPELNQIADLHLAPGFKRSLPPSTTAVATASEPETRQILGPSAVPVPLTLNWYVDVRSPLAATQADLVRQITAHYDGRVRVLFHAFPLASHPDGALASAALLAALAEDREKFWPMFDALAQRRDMLDRDKLVLIAAGIGLDRNAFLAGLEASAPAVDSDHTEAERRGIQGAPVLFLNEKRVDGLQRMQFYTDILDRELATNLQASAQK